VPAAYPEPPGKLIMMRFESSSLSTDYYFTGGAPQTLSLDRPRPVYLTGNRGLWADHWVGPKLSYTLTAVVPDLKPGDLVGRGRDYPQDVAPFRLLPFPSVTAVSGSGLAPEREWRDAMSERPAAREWQGLWALNREIVGAATDPYRIALLIEEYLRFNYGYSLTPPDTAYKSPYAAFLFDTRVGFCQHFAGAMAVLLRFNGIPARVALGFTAGSRVTHDTFLVTRNDAHAWVEVYFPGVGWVPFDPTPGRNLPGPGPSSTSAGFTDPFGGDSIGRGAPLPIPSSDPRALQQDSTTGQGIGSAGAPVSPSGGLGWFAWAGALAALAVAWPAARTLRRRRRTRRGDLERRLRASLALLYADLRDFGVRVPSSQTLEETARLLGESLDVDATTVVDRVQAVLFGGRAATPEDLAQIERLRHDLRRRLRARRGWTRTLAALYGFPAAAAARS
jgi:transglutaminase-like putative cysteine protease